MTSHVTVLTPIAEEVTTQKDMSPRVTDLTDLTVGVLDNGKPNADLLMDYIEAQLDERFTLAGTVRRSKRHSGRTAEHLYHLAAHCDVVINGVGD